MASDERARLESALESIDERLGKLDSLSEREKRRTFWQEERDGLQGLTGPKLHICSKFGT